MYGQVLVMLGVNENDLMKRNKCILRLSLLKYRFRFPDVVRRCYVFISTIIVYPGLLRVINLHTMSREKITGEIKMAPSN